jgi:hypothetical protein
MIRSECSTCGSFASSPSDSNMPTACDPVTAVAGTGIYHPVGGFRQDSGGDVVTKQVKRRFQGHVGCINAVAISDKSETYLSASYDATVRRDGRSQLRTHQILSKPGFRNERTRCSRRRGWHSFGQGQWTVWSELTIYAWPGATTVAALLASMAPTHDGECLVVSALTEPFVCWDFQIVSFNTSYIHTTCGSVRTGMLQTSD